VAAKLFTSLARLSNDIRNQLADLASALPADPHFSYGRGSILRTLVTGYRTDDRTQHSFDWQHDNRFATISVLLFATLASWSQPLLNRCIYFALLIVSAVCLAFSVSATSALSLLIAAMVMIYLHLAFSLRLGLIAMIVLGVLVCALAGIAFYYIDTAELIGRSGDWSGSRLGNSYLKNL